MADRVGQQFGNYRLEALLGTGGFAQVYLGQHVRLNQQAAIKVLHAHLTAREAEHFQQEAQTIATLMHPGIVRVFDYDVQDGVPFLVMDYAPGGSLRQRYPKGSLVPLPLLVSYVKQVAAALQYAQEHKFIHRDVKPENMLLGRREEVLLSDFGLAALAHSSASLSTQEAIGTISYMAPEQIEGHPRAASDQYALAVVVYEWLCGSRPFEGSATEVLVQQLSMPPPPLHERIPTMPLELEQVVLRALAKDPKARFATVTAFAEALERASQPASVPPVLLVREAHIASPAGATSYNTETMAPSQPLASTEASPSADRPVGELAQTAFAGSPVPNSLDTPQSGARAEVLQLGQTIAHRAEVVSSPLAPTRPVKQKPKRLPRRSATVLIGLAVVIIMAGVVGSLGLLARLGVLGAHSGPPAIQVARGGTWTYGLYGDVGSLIPNSPAGGSAMMGALYLPLFYGDAQGVIQPGAASEVPTIQNGEVNADATTWTFRLRPHLLWSDGQPYDARDVDFTWKLWLNPQFGAGSTLGLNLLSTAEVSADHLSITFHLKRPFAPFLADLWVDSPFAPLPAHHFSSLAPAAILKSPDNLNPKVTSGPFMMAESVPGDHYTLVRNPLYYRAREGLPYLDKVVFGIADTSDLGLKQLQAGSLDAIFGVTDVQNFQVLKHLKNYTLIYPPAQNAFEALFFNFHNQVLASHLEVRQAMAMAVDQQTIIAGPLKGLGMPLCTDHPSAYHPGFDPNAPCPVFGLAAANQLLDDNGWVRGSDGVRAKDRQRLEFEYSASVTGRPERTDVESIIQRDFQQLGIKLDIQNYPFSTFFGPFLTGGKASPPTGAVADKYDIAEFSNTPGPSYDPDDSSLLGCDQFPPNGNNLDFYCNRTLDSLYQQEQTTTDPGVRQQLFEQIHQLYLVQLPFIVLYSPTGFGLAHKGTHNYLPGAFDDTYNIAQWWCDNGKC